MKLANHKLPHVRVNNNVDVTKHPALTLNLSSEQALTICKLSLTVRLSDVKALARQQLLTDIDYVVDERRGGVRDSLRWSHSCQ
jgi:hypothetical protein